MAAASWVTLRCVHILQSILKVLKKRQEMATLAPPYRKMKKYRYRAGFRIFIFR